MNTFSNDEFTNMLIVYEAADYPCTLLDDIHTGVLRIPQPSQSMNRRLRDTGCLTRSTMNPEQTTRTLGSEKTVLYLAEENLSTYTRTIGQQLGFLPCQENSEQTKRTHTTFNASNH